MRIVFMGSPDFAVPCLSTLLDTDEVVGVVCQPDKPAGRGQKLTPPPVKERALAEGLRVMQPASVRKPPFLDELRALAPDLAVVVAYGKILPPEVLAAPRLGCINVHGSLLPKYRGAAPIQWALIRGEPETGITLMQMDAGMDTGPMLLKRAIPVDEQVTAGELFQRLAPLGAETLRDGLALLKEGKLRPEPQNDAEATLAPMLTKETGRVDFSVGATAVRDLVRGCDPWPGAYTLLGGEVLKLFRPRRVSGSGTPGQVIGADRDGLIVACGPPGGADGALNAVAFAELQLPGRKRMPAQALLAGRAIPTGTQLGS